MISYYSCHLNPRGRHYYYHGHVTRVTFTAVVILTYRRWPNIQPALVQRLMLADL